MSLGDGVQVGRRSGTGGVGGCDVSLQLLQVPLQLGAPVLEPRDHLGVGEAQRGGDLVSVGRGQVLLVEEALLQLVDLLVREGRPRLASLLGRLRLGEEAQLIASCRFCKV